MSQRACVKAKIVNTLGMHARPATEFVELASTFKSAVRVRKDDQEVDGKSIMHMMLLAATRGSELEIECEGPDAQACCRALKALVDAGFHED